MAVGLERLLLGPDASDDLEPRIAAAGVNSEKPASGSGSRPPLAAARTGRSRTRTACNASSVPSVSTAATFPFGRRCSEATSSHRTRRRVSRDRVVTVSESTTVRVRSTQTTMPTGTR